MNKEKLVKIRDLLELSNVELGMELGYTHTKYQCKQVDNLVAGTSVIKPVLVLALECLARRRNKLKQFKEIMEQGNSEI